MTRIITILAIVLLAPVIALAQWSGQTVSIQVSPTLDTSAYAAGDCLHATAIEMANIGSSGTVEGVVISDKSGQGKNIDAVIFKGEPTTICAAVNSAFDPADADLLLVAGTSKITQHAVYNDNGLSENITTKVPYRFTGGSLYLALVSREAVTYGADDLTVTVFVRRDF